MAILLSHLGELAALATATCWAGSALCFEIAGREIGSLVVNLLRLILAFGMLTLACWVLRGQALPVDASSHAWLWLSLSGLVGYVFGDLCLFQAFVVLGARLASQIMTLAPCMAALIGWLVLGETLSVFKIVAMLVTTGGVMLAMTEPVVPLPDGSPDGPQPRTPHASRMGLGSLLALGGALGQAGGLVLSKMGMGSYSAMAATQIRIIAGVAGFAAVVSIASAWPRVWAARRSRRGLVSTSLGALLGPTMGVSLSLFAVQHTTTGVAASLMATSPVLIIPMAALVRREPISVRGVLGAGMALAGVILLFA